jgi:hypothetical protein
MKIKNTITIEIAEMQVFIQAGHSSSLLVSTLSIGLRLFGPPNFPTIGHLPGNPATINLRR